MVSDLNLPYLVSNSCELDTVRSVPALLVVGCEACFAYSVDVCYRPVFSACEVNAVAENFDSLCVGSECDCNVTSFLNVELEVLAVVAVLYAPSVIFYYLELVVSACGNVFIDDIVFTICAESHVVCCV